MAAIANMNSMDPFLRQWMFDSAVSSPGGWIFSAIDLKTAADRLNWLSNPVRDEEPSVGLFAIYRMLMGMSLECLLKGILVAQGVQVVGKGDLTKEFATHALTALALKIDNSAFTFMAGELTTLANIEPYILWAGKYPFPKRPEELQAKTHSSTELNREAELWDRLYEHLKAVGWVMKGGNRLPLTHRFGSAG